MQKGDSSLPSTSTNPYQELRTNLLLTTSWLNNHIRSFLQPFGITPKQYHILQILAHHHPDSMPIQQIRNLMVDKMSDTSRLVDRLVQKEMVEKIPCSHDRRSNRALISPKGQELLQSIADQIDQLDRIFANLQENQAQELNKLLKLARGSEYDSDLCC